MLQSIGSGGNPTSSGITREHLHPCAAGREEIRPRMMLGTKRELVKGDQMQGFHPAGKKNSYPGPPV